MFPWSYKLEKYNKKLCRQMKNKLMWLASHWPMSDFPIFTCHIFMFFAAYNELLDQRPFNNASLDMKQFVLQKGSLWCSMKILLFIYKLKNNKTKKNI